MNKMRGFTLIEMMIVVAIIAILAAIAVPNLLRSRIQTNEASAVQGIRAIVSAQTSYNTQHGHYTQDFADLTVAVPPFLNGDWSKPKNGYTFTLSGTADNYSVNADPQFGVTGNHGFFCDGSGVIRSESGASAGTASTPIGE